MQNKRDILSEKRDGAKKSVSLCPKAVMLIPMQSISLGFDNVYTFLLLFLLYFCDILFNGRLPYQRIFLCKYIFI